MNSPDSNCIHASQEQLLEIKDGLENEASIHVEQCDVCKNELFQLNAIVQGLYDQACEQSAFNELQQDKLWARIVEKVDQGKPENFDEDMADPQIQGLMEANLAMQNSAVQSSKMGGLTRAIYSLAASVMVTGFVGMYVFSQSNQVSQDPLLHANIEQLMLNSRGMELALQNVASQPESLSLAERSAAERLQWRLTYLDELIHNHSADSEQDILRVEQLWNDRVRALTELNKLYYQRQKVVSESEI